MWRIKVLASGSKGNSTLVQTDDGAFLIDAGLSGRELERRLDMQGVRISDLEGVIVTHEHQDHCMALKVIAKKRGLKIYCNRGTAYELKKTMSEYEGWNIFETGRQFFLGGVQIKAYKVSHDAAEPVAIVMSYHGCRFAVVTDLGKATNVDIEELRGLNGILLEANYDLKMLQEDTIRPWETKQRIMSRFGHLSNEAARDFLKQIAWEGLDRVILGHLSQDCNDPQIAVNCVKQGAHDQSMSFIKIDAASQELGADAWQWR